MFIEKTTLNMILYTNALAPAGSKHIVDLNAVSKDFDSAGYDISVVSFVESPDDVPMFPALEWLSAAGESCKVIMKHYIASISFNVDMTIYAVSFPPNVVGFSVSGGNINVTNEINFPNAFLFDERFGDYTSLVYMEDVLGAPLKAGLGEIINFHIFAFKEV